MGVWWKSTLWSPVHLHCGLVGNQREGVRHEGGEHLVHLVLLLLELMIDYPEVWDWERWWDQAEAELICASAKWLLQGTFRVKWNYFEDKKKFFHNKLPQVAFSDDCSWHNWSQLTFWHFFHFVFLSLCLYVFLYCYPFASFTIDTTNPFREIFPAFFFDVKKHQLYISYYTQDGQYGWFEETRQWKFSKVKIFSFWVLLCCTTIPPIHRALTAVFVAESQGRST